MTFILFALVGTISTLTDILSWQLIFPLLKRFKLNIPGLNYQATSQIFSYSLGALVSFILNLNFTFTARGLNFNSPGLALKFLLANVFMVIFSTIITQALTPVYKSLFTYINKNYANKLGQYSFFKKTKFTYYAKNLQSFQNLCLKLNIVAITLVLNFLIYNFWVFI